MNTLSDSRHNRDFLHLALVVKAAHLGRVSQKNTGAALGGGVARSKLQRRRAQIKHHVLQLEEVRVELRNVLVVAWGGQGGGGQGGGLGLVLVSGWEARGGACSVGEGEGNAFAAHDLVHCLEADLFDDICHVHRRHFSNLKHLRGRVQSVNVASSSERCQQLCSHSTSERGRVHPRNQAPSALASSR